MGTQESRAEANRRESHLKRQSYQTDVVECSIPLSLAQDRGRDGCWVLNDRWWMDDARQVARGRLNGRWWMVGLRDDDEYEDVGDAHETAAEVRHTTRHGLSHPAPA